MSDPVRFESCPACTFAPVAGENSCPKCGLVFAKYLKRQQSPGPRPAPHPAAATAGAGQPPAVEETALLPAELSDEHPFRTAPLDARAWGSLAGGGLLALLVLSLEQVDFIFQTFVVLVHELGHALFGWLFGYPSLPAFDFLYGGGVTMHRDRSPALLVVLFALYGFALWVYRRNRLTLGIISGLALIHVLAAFTRLHEVINLFMGHGTELIIAGIFLYRGISGFAVVHPVERPLYAFLGLFVLLSDLRFAWRLLTDPVHRALYEEAKGGGHWMDFSRIAEEYLHVDLAAVALFFLFCCFLPLAVIVLYRLRRTEILLFLNRAFDRAPSSP